MKAAFAPWLRHYWAITTSAISTIAAVLPAQLWGGFSQRIPVDFSDHRIVFGSNRDGCFPIRSSEVPPLKAAVKLAAKRQLPPWSLI